VVNTLDFYTALNSVKQVLKADFACEASDFETAGVFIHHAKELPGRRRFPFREKSFSAASMGRGVVISCSLERLGWADAHLSNLSRNDIFTAATVAKIEELVKKDGQTIAGPDLKHICTRGIFQPFQPGGDIEITLVEDEKKLEQYNDDDRFLNTRGHPNNPRRVAAFATVEGKIAGIASACADSDILWQIGVDTLEPYRSRGIGKATVSAVTAYVLHKGIIPYYSSFETNLASRAVAAALGYKIAWLELYAREAKK
jgi:GNAT superfamily N-acetyltransferase